MSISTRVSMANDKSELRLVLDVYSVCYIMDWGTNEIEFALPAQIPEPSMARRLAVGGKTNRTEKRNTVYWWFSLSLYSK